MSIQASAYGRLGGAPRQINTKTGRSMVVANLAVDQGNGDDDAPPLWIGLVCFGQLAETLLRHDKGDPLSVSGRLQMRSWTDTEGAGREQLQLVVDAMVSARAVRPGGGRKAGQGDAGPGKRPATVFGDSAPRRPSSYAAPSRGASGGEDLDGAL